MSPPKQKRDRDALKLLLTGKLQRKSGIVKCPAGCGGSFFEHTINAHLDKCLQTSLPPHALVHDAVMEAKHDVYGDAHAHLSSSSCNDSTKKRSCSNALEDCSTPREDAFQHLMRNAKRHFAFRDQTLHLHDSGVLELCDQTKSCAWSTTVELKPNKICDQKIRLNISTSIQPGADNALPKRFVKSHSRLAIPVLKSILQKSVRRRRPIPATKVAMELADKSLDSLLRRLPIIILEDSTLHPDFSFLVWLMVANSKGYTIPGILIERVLHIVYQVASCPFKDSPAMEDSPSPSHEFDKLFRDTKTPPTDFWKTSLFAMSVRLSYGGMDCDLRMLQAYAYAWHSRCCLQKSETSKPANFQGSNGENECEWTAVPEKVHTKPKEQGLARVSELMENGIERLYFDDVCIEGVDFHCSGIVDQLASDPELFKACVAQLLQQSPTSKKQRVSKGDVVAAIKTCMWRFSSGTNYRRSLIADDRTDKPRGAHYLEDLWRNTLQLPARTYMKEFIETRL